MTNDIGQGIGHNAHERVAAKIDDRVVEGFVLFCAARALQLFLNAPQTLYLFGGAGLDGDAVGLQLDGAAHAIDGLVINFPQKQHKMQRLRQILSHVVGQIVARTLSALQHTHALEQTQTVAYGAPADAEILRQCAFGGQAIARTQLSLFDQPSDVGTYVLIAVFLHAVFLLCL